MFKKIVSIVVVVMMIAGMAAIAVHAADDGSAVGANSDDSAAIAAGSGDDSVGADDSGSAGVGGKAINFKADKSLWKSFKTITCYIYEHGGDKLITWGSKKGNMTNTGGDVWSFDLDKAGIELKSGKQYGVIFTADWNAQSCDLIMDSSCIGDTAALTGDQVENNVDSNKKSYVVHWDGKDPMKLGPPVCITSIGNVIGEAYWDGDTPYSMLVQFIKSDGKDGLSNAIKFNGKDEQQTLDDTAKALGLGQDDIEKAIKEAGKEGKVKWTKSASKATPGSSAAGGGDGSSDSSSGDGSSSGGSAGGSDSSGGGSSAGGSSSGGSSSGSSGSSSVTSGQETTIFFVFGGVMLAAAGIIFLARKRRDY